MFLDICKTIVGLAYGAASIGIAVAVAHRYPGSDLQHAILPWLAFYAMGVPAMIFGEH